MKTEIEIAADLEDWDLVISIAQEYKLSKCWFDMRIRAAYNRVLNITAIKNKTNAFIALINVGASAVSACDNETGNYAIHYAVINRNTDILGLLSNNENLKLKNNAGKTAIELASDLGYWEIAIVLEMVEVELELEEKKKVTSANGVLKQKSSVPKIQTYIDPSYRKVTNDILFFSVKKPSIAQLKKTYQSNVRFFSFQPHRIFKGKNVNKIIQRLRERDKGYGGASEKTLKAHGLR